MKRNLLILVISLSLFLSACTVRILTPTHVDYSTGQQLYSVKTAQFGPALPVITVIVPRQMTRR